MEAVLGLLLFCIASAAGNSAGPPTSVCSTLLPGHPGDPSEGNGGYLISTTMSPNPSLTGYEYSAGQTYTVTLNGTVNMFRGFAVQSVAVPGGTTVGNFVPEGANQQILDCPEGNHTITHDNPAPNTMNFTIQTFTWDAPEDSDGVVDFLYTVVRSNPGEYYVRNSAIAENRPYGIKAPVTSADDYPLVFKTPSTCNRSDCTVFVGIERNAGNQDYLNFYIEGESGAWVAVGFSSTPNMFSADVLACNLNPDTGMIEVLDTWNVAASGRANINDDVMDTFLFSGASNDGRITCSFGRSINGTGNTHDVNLGGDYYVIYGRRSGSPSAGGVSSHLGNEDPSVSADLVNLLTSTGVQAGDSFQSVKNGLVRAHGILMLIAWPLLAVNAIHFATVMKGNFPNGEWFQIHRAFMITSLILTALGFIFIFVAQARNGIPGLSGLGSANAITRATTAHFALGILVLCLQIANPLIAIFRCKPKEKNRWIFDRLHGFPGVGFFAIVAALFNVGLGLSIFSSQYSYFRNHGIFWGYLSFGIYFLSSYTIRQLIFMIYRMKHWNKDKSDSVQVHHDADKETVTIEADGDVEKKDDVALKQDGDKCGSSTTGCRFNYYWLGYILVAWSFLLVLIISIIVALPRRNN